MTRFFQALAIYPIVVVEGPWKRKTLIEFGILNQCLSSNKIDELYLINVLLKINVKVVDPISFAR